MKTYPILILVMCAAAVCAQEATLRTSLHFYGDDTEFTGPYREGDTLFGVHLASALELRLSEGFSVRAGAWAHRRHGSGDFFDETRPILAAEFSGRRSTFVLGGYFPENRHGFLDALQDPRLEFTRPLENGLQWTHEGPRHRFQMFLNWQRYATSERREIFDAGLLARGGLSASWALDVQVHAWHRGGQVARAGTVASNNAAALGVLFTPRFAAAWRLCASLHLLGSRATREAEFPLRRSKGHGILGRLEAWPWTRAGVYALYWDARDFSSFEGDPNYNSQGMEPGTYVRKRRYAEAGVMAAWDVVPYARLEGRLALNVVDDSEVTPSLRFSLRIPVDIRLGRIPAPPE